MQLNHGLHLAYCTNIHRGETWPETFQALEQYSLAVRDRICPGRPYAIGLRLGNQAARQLSQRATLLEFQRWLEKNNCYVFTINGFPFGQFHGARIKEQVYLPDWSSEERLDYTNLLFDLLAQLMPGSIEGSVSTVPCGFKEPAATAEKWGLIRANLWRCVEQVARLSERSGRQLHLGLEPEPLCLLETSAETIAFFDQMRSEHPNDHRLAQHLGVNYDTCHLAVEFEEPQNALGSLLREGIRISKLHLSSALKVRPSGETRRALETFVEGVYLHQVVVRRSDGAHQVYRDLNDALAKEPAGDPGEWRIHFHIPLHSEGSELFGNTADHILGVLDLLKASHCSHLEMETYTWEVLPPELRNRSVVEQLVAEYEWTLARLGERGFRPEA